MKITVAIAESSSHMKGTGLPVIFTKQTDKALEDCVSGVFLLFDEEATSDWT